MTVPKIINQENMDNTKYTKGKWSVERVEDTIYDQEVFAISTPVYPEFITVWNGVEQLEEEQQANALLISKAPEMLDFINRISGEMLRNDFVLEEKWYEQAQKLIKEATTLEV